ncbi:MAG: DUF4143 domain-containing protein, partial [Bdellovibrionales bacterium]|nr:DUF4143 domain-containing protein [Bdellovibrionales bacterium]
VGNCLSINSFAIELQKDHKTIQRWLNILEDLFVIFKVTPYSKDISRSIKKEPKYYFYDSGFVAENDSAKLENVVACALLKESHRLLDAEGVAIRLHYLKVKGGREIDFALIPESKEYRASLIEVKTSDTDVSPNFKLFKQHFKNPKQIQLVQNITRDFTTADNVEVMRASEWLCNFKI